jgi:hypothetical protein
MALPELLSEDVWQRHGYSLADIRRTLDVFPARVIWQLVLSYNRAATNASSRVCSDAEPRLTSGGRSTAVQKLLTALKETHAELETKPSVTWNGKDDDADGMEQVPKPLERHQPGLPVHRLEHAVFDEIARYVSVSSSAVSSADPVPAVESAPFVEPKPNPTTTAATAATADDDADDRSTGFGQPRLAKGIFSWRGILVAPLELSRAGDLLLMSRVVPWQSYVAAHGVPTTLRACPNAVLAPEGFYALLDECFFFFAGRRDDDIRMAAQIRAGISATAANPAIPTAAAAAKTDPISASVSASAQLWTADTDDSKTPARKRVRIESNKY